MKNKGIPGVIILFINRQGNKSIIPVSGENRVKISVVKITRKKSRKINTKIYEKTFDSVRNL